MRVAYTCFGTSIGSCAIAWNERGVVGVLLPETTGEATLQKLRQRWPSGDAEANPPTAVAEAICALKTHLDGQAADLSSIVIDDHGLPPFAHRVYAAARAIPSGETRTYGEVAKSIGSPGAARAVGQALGKNPFPLIVPCHRVLGSGHAGGFTAPGGLDTKERILSIEGVTLRAPRLPHVDP